MLTEFESSLKLYEICGLKIVTYYLENTLGHPYEDSFKIGPVIKRGRKKYLPLILADGATSLRKNDGSYPQPSPAKELADLICQKAAEFLKENLIKAINIKTVCRKVLELDNSLAFNYNQAYGLKEEKLAGSTLVLALLELSEEETVVYWASIGDSLLILFSSQKPKIINPDQSRNLKVKKKALQKYLGISDRDFSIWHRLNLRNKHYQFDGVDVGYGVLTGEEGAKDYFVSGKIRIKKGDWLLLASDGVVETGLDVLEKVIRNQHLPFERKLPFAFGKVLTILQSEGKKNDDLSGILVKIK